MVECTTPHHRDLLDQHRRAMNWLISPNQKVATNCRRASRF
jgi:hypothetical protein